MMQHVVEVALGARRYDIVIGPGLLREGTRLGGLIRGRHAMLVSNPTVAGLYAAPVRAALAEKTCAEYLMPDGESHKSLDELARVFAALAQLQASRDATVLALGGGVVGDLAGFAAACWMRGVPYVQLPTTLLAMVDSAVGGKTAVNLPQGKNLVGAFHQPSAVLADTDCLNTLPEREYRAGLAEVVKYGAIGDADFLAWLTAHAAALSARTPDSLTEAIAVSCRHKAAIVARDEHEQGERALLNFGHTFAHALETCAGYGTLLHGEAVAIGMVCAARLSARLGMATAQQAGHLRDLLHRLGLPTAVPSGLAPDALLDAMRLDKKNTSGALRLILWHGPGRAVIVPDVPVADIAVCLAPV
jgi:3-dehydroquinate synthase